jgi:hypothetical protein
MWSRSRSHRLPGAVLVALTVLASGCVRGAPGQASPFGEGREPEEPVRVTIKNHDFRDAVLYATWEGRARERVGTVTGKTEQTFSVPWKGSTVVFQAQLIAGKTITFDRMDAWDGDHFELVILNQG